MFEPSSVPRNDSVPRKEFNLSSPLSLPNPIDAAYPVNGLLEFGFRLSDGTNYIADSFGDGYDIKLTSARRGLSTLCDKVFELAKINTRKDPALFNALMAEVQSEIVEWGMEDDWRKAGLTLDNQPHD